MASTRLQAHRQGYSKKAVEEHPRNSYLQRLCLLRPSGRVQRTLRFLINAQKILVKGGGGQVQRDSYILKNPSI